MALLSKDLIPLQVYNPTVRSCAVLIAAKSYGAVPLGEAAPNRTASKKKSDREKLW